MYFELFLIIATVGLVSGYPNGPPVVNHPEICATMFPSGHQTEVQNSTPPFEITFNPAYYADDVSVTVTVKVLDDYNTYYEGLFLQARDASDGNRNMSFGVFTPDENTLQTFDCFQSGRQNAIGQTAAAHYTVKSFEWKSTKGLMKDLKFTATIVHETDEFWTGVQSATIKYHQDCQTSTSPRDLVNVSLLVFVLIITI